MAGLVVVGHLTRDVVDSQPSRAGGPVFYAARALRALRERAVLVTRCGPEDEDLLRRLQALGLPVVRLPGPSAAFRLEYRGELRLLTVDALGRPWTPEELGTLAAAALRDADWVHAAALWRGEFAADTLHALGRGRRLSLDGQGLVRPPRLGPVDLDGVFDPAVLAAVDVLHLSEPEADALGLGLDERSLRTLGVPEIVVTLGDRGCVVYADDLAEHVPARAVADVDPTGAGDVFTAAYVTARRHGHLPVPAAQRATALVHGLLSGRLRA